MCTAPCSRHDKVRSYGLLILAAFFVAASTVTPAQTLTTLASFGGTNGQNPYAVIQGRDGNLYGTTSAGGANGGGTIFKISADGSITTLYSFCSQRRCADGETPLAGLVQGNDGKLYGTTSAGGGVLQEGVVFKINTDGTMMTTLHAFDTDNGEGGGPQAVLTQGTDSNFYGTTFYGGAAGAGTVFEITPDGALTSIYSFCSQSNCTDGTNPWAGLVLGVDGNFYGTTSGGGAFHNSFCDSSGCGTVFKITPNGMLTTLYSFCQQESCTDGALPVTGLVQATDGNFYGTSAGGNVYGTCVTGCGTLFRITPSGDLTNLHDFDLTHGAAAYGTLWQAADGNLYGTTYAGGNGCQDGCGTLFKMSLSGTFTVLHYFDGSDGSGLEAGVIQASDGSFYGTATLGGTGSCDQGCGTVFKFSGISPTAVQLIPVTPCRVVDTRNQDGQFGGPPLTGNSSRNFPIPQGSCDIPASAIAYSLNVTVVPHHPLNYLTIWPTGQMQPVVSTLNSPDGRVKANAAIVPAGSGGAVSVYVTDTTDVILDIDGYFTAPGAETLQFYPLTPCRVVDTRDPSHLMGLGPPSLQDMEVRRLPILTTTCPGLPSNPLAYSFNVTVVPTHSNPLGYLTVWPSDQQQPVVSTLNNPTATVVANAAIVPAAANGDVSVFAYNSTDVIMDINGYFAVPGTGGYSFYPVTPCRVYDSRLSGGMPFTGQRTVDIAGSPCAPPATAAGYVFNATVVPSGSLGYLTLWPHGQQQEPVVSTLNAYDGYITSNMAIVPNMDGSTNTDAAYGYTHLILDISGYFAP